MTITRPNLAATAVRDGKFDKHITDLLDALIRAANTGTDTSGIEASIALLQSLHLYGTGGITVTGTLETGFRIHLNASSSDGPLASQIFGS